MAKQPKPRSIFIRSSAKLKPDPDYYRKKGDYFRRKWHQAIEDAGYNRDVQPLPGPETPAIDRKIAEFRDKTLHYNRMLVAASNFHDKLKTEGKL